MDSTTTTNAILLVIAGFLGFIAGHVSGMPLFGLGGLVAFLFAAAIGVGSFIHALKDGMDSREPARPRRAVDPFASVPAAPNVPAKRQGVQRDYSSL